MWNLASASAIWKARSMLPLLAKKGARSRAAVRRSEKVATAITAETSGVCAAACKATPAPSEIPNKMMGRACTWASTRARSCFS